MFLFHSLRKLKPYRRANVLSLIGFCAWLFSASAYAQSACNATAFGQMVQSATQMVDFGTVNVPASLPVGGEIAMQESSPVHTSRTYCTYGNFWVDYQLTRFTTPAPAGGTNVYATNVPGIGIEIAGGSSGSSYTGFYPARFQATGGQFGWGYTRSNFRVRLIKTAQVVGSGTIASSTLIAQQVVDGIVIMKLGMGSTTVVGSTCTVNTAGVNIPLGNVAGGSFASVGSVSPTSGAQNIGLTCSNSPRVRMTLQGVQAAGGPNTTVALTGAGGAGVAQGIGVQVLYGGNPLVVNSATPTTVSAAAGATLNVPVAARYYRTGTVTAGRANASPTLRFDYN